jgi:hypothetical protein
VTKTWLTRAYCVTVVLMTALAAGFAALLAPSQAHADQFYLNLYASCLAGYGVRFTDINAAATMGKQVLVDITPLSPPGAEDAEFTKLRHQYGLDDTTARAVYVCAFFANRP